MPISGQADLRANQKARTRTALVQAATELLREGSPPTVGEVAGRAKVSRATAYRYFPTQDALLLEITGLKPTMEPVEKMLEALDTDDAADRLRMLLDTFTPIVLAEEAQMRTALRLYLDMWLENRRQGEDAPVREGRRMRWLDEALRPAVAHLSAAQQRRLKSALALTLSIDAVVVLKDVCHLDDDEVLDTLQWAADALLQVALAEARPARVRGSGS